MERKCKNGCERRYYCKGMCKVCYNRDRAARGLDGQWFSCKYSKCDNEFYTSSKGQVYCSPSCHKLAKSSRYSKPRQVRSPRTADCRFCGEEFTMPAGYRGGTPWYCGGECRSMAQGKVCQGCGGQREANKWFCVDCKALNKQALRKRQNEYRNERRRVLRAAGLLSSDSHRSRARKYEVEYVPLKKSDVFDRDNWICQICDNPVEDGLEYPHPFYPTIDHIIPMSKGGGHIPANVQLAHAICNSYKCDFIDESEYTGRLSDYVAQLPR